MLFYINFKYLHNKFIIQYIILTRYGNTIHLIRGRNILSFYGFRWYWEIKILRIL